MDFSPRIQRLVAQIQATQLKAESSVVQLAADVRQILLATTVDIEQRWVFLTPEDRIEALTDLIALTVIYNRAFSESVLADDLSVLALSKAATEGLTSADQSSWAYDKPVSDTATPLDAFSRTLVYQRLVEDPLPLDDLLTLVVQFTRGFSESALLADVPTWAYDRPVLDQATATDVVGLATSLPFVEQVGILADVSVVEPQLARTESLSATDDSAKALSPAYEETLSQADAATLDFATQIQELVAAAEDFARTVDFARSVTETAPVADAPAKTFTTAFFDIGGPYAEVNYFADDYVEVGTGPAVYDTFSYTLA